MFSGKKSWMGLNGNDFKTESRNDLEQGQEDSEASSRTEGYYTPSEEEPKLETTGNTEQENEATQRLDFRVSSVSLPQQESPASNEYLYNSHEDTTNSSPSGTRELYLENTDVDTNLEQLKQLGNSFFIQGDYAAAINCYDAILDSAPKKLSALANRAMCYLKLENFDKAIQDSETCIETNPVWPKGYYIKGMALLHQGKAEMAASCFGHGLEFCPSDRKLIEGKRKALQYHISGNISESLEGTKGSAFPLSKSITSNNEESQNFTNFTEGKENAQQNLDSAEDRAVQLEGGSSRTEQDETGASRRLNESTNTNRVGKSNSFLSVETEASRIVNAPNFYSVLRVPLSCTREEVEQNYKMLSNILNSFESKGENVEAAKQIVETAHDVLSSTIKRRLYERFLQDRKKRNRRNLDPSSVQNHLEITESGQNARWHIDDTQVPLPKFLDYILRIRKVGWFLLLLLFFLFLPVIIVLVLVGVILWFSLSPIATAIRKWFPSPQDSHPLESHVPSEARGSQFPFFRHRRMRSGNFLCLPIGS